MTFYSPVVIIKYREQILVSEVLIDMKRFLKNLGFRKPDEMERHIIFRAQRNSYFFLMAALLIWSFWESCKVYIYHTRLNLIPCLLLAGAALIQSFSQLVMTRNAVKDDEDSFETAPLLKIIVLVCVTASAIATAGAALLLMGVRT